MGLDLLGTVKMFYFTFGNGHPFSGYYVEIDASGMASAREEMFRYFGPKWCTSYRELDDVHENDKKEGKLGCTIFGI